MGEFEGRDGFPYFWLGAGAESIPTPWRTVWLGSPTEERTPAPKFDRGRISGSTCGGGERPR
jgi:hypothetical protein